MLSTVVVPMFTDDVSCWIDSNSSDVSELLFIKLTNSNNCGLLSRRGRNTECNTKGIVYEYVPLSGIQDNADTALRADLFSSSCFSYSCLTELALTLKYIVVFSGSINLSIPIMMQYIQIMMQYIQIMMQYVEIMMQHTPVVMQYIQKLNTHVAVERWPATLIILSTTRRSTSNMTS